jgi:hypothetical protein
MTPFRLGKVKNMSEDDLTRRSAMYSRFLRNQPFRITDLDELCRR